MSQSLLSDECPSTCSTGSPAGSVPNLAVTYVAKTFSVTFCVSLVGCVYVRLCAMQYSLAVGQYWAEAARYLSDSLILPLSATSYAEALRQLVRQLNDTYGRLMTSNGLSLGRR